MKFYRSTVFKIIFKSNIYKKRKYDLKKGSSLIFMKLYAFQVNTIFYFIQTCIRNKRSFETNPVNTIKKQKTTSLKTKITSLKTKITSLKTKLTSPKIKLISHNFTQDQYNIN